MPGAYSSKRCFLFDLDGTLVDSTAAHARAFVDALTPGHPALAAGFDYAPFAGRPTREVFLTLGIRNEPELTKLTLLKQQNYRDALERGEVEIFGGAVPLLDHLRRNGARLFLVTGASRISTERVLARTKLGAYFEDVATADDVRDGKPSPAPFLHTLTKHGLEKQACLVIEDGASGVISAQSAGLDVVLIHANLELADVPNVRDFKSLMQLLAP
jgi:HAD superfamily hydrolase (TIGR01509 family)